MRERKPETRERPLPALAFSVAAMLLCGFVIGCANPGPPRPPSLQLPEPVSDLSAERVGDRVLIRWSTPDRTTDGFDTKGALTAEICRSSGPAAKLNKSLDRCIVAKRLSVAPGASSAYDDLPQPLLGDPVRLLTYRIEIFNAASRSAGSSNLAFAASGVAPPPVASLTATASEAGAVLKWNRPASGDSYPVNLARTDLTAPAPAIAPNHKTTDSSRSPARRAASTHAGRAESPARNEIHLRAAAPATSNGLEAGTIDTSARMGKTYSYVVQQVRLISIDGHPLELHSLVSPAAVLAMRDTFPPMPPSGLAAIPGATEAATGTPPSPYIDLSWEPNPEPDLAGYFVYRQLARPNGDPQGPLGRLTPLPIPAPAYRDVAVAPGQRYIYSVTAVDASGNESAPSAKTTEVAEDPNVVGSPQ